MGALAVLAENLGSIPGTQIEAHNCLHIMPLSKKLQASAMEVFAKLAVLGNCEYDEAGSIGKRYRRQDAIGTPFCVTVDFETENDGCVTVRERDTMKQERVKITELVSYIENRVKL